MLGLPTLVQYRRIAETTGRFPWFRRRSSPFAVTDTYTSLPDGSQPCGHDATSPCMRYFRLLISVVPYSFHAFDCASVNVAAPGVCTVKSGDALTVPPMPCSSLREWTLPCMFGICGGRGPAMMRRIRSRLSVVLPMMLNQNPSASGTSCAD